ncbi:MAG: hypothetical protein QOE91_69 [Gaiellaceae bacterium]|nr:hypothetical protein [Gaiellaceae bacterium]
MRRLALAATAVVLAAPAAAGAADRTVERAHVTVSVEPNGILHVTDRRLLHAPAPYTAAVDVSMRQGELFAEPAVTVGGRRFHAGDSRAAATFLVSKETTGIRIAWRQPAGTHEASVSYRLALCGVAYEDVVDLPVVLWSGGSLPRLDASVVLPRSPRGPVYAWLDPKSTTATVATGGRQIRVRARGLTGSLALRLAFPRAVLSSTAGTVVHPGAGLAHIVADESRPPTNRKWTAIVAGISVGAALVAVALLYRSRRRNS